MLSYNQLNDIFQTQLGRSATSDEYTRLSNAPLSYLTNLKSTGYNTNSYPTTILQPGMTGNTVKQLQDYLVNSGYMTRDQVNTGYGIYGPRTTAAVLALQKNLGIDYSSGPGYYGPRTLAALQARNQPQQPQQPQQIQQQIQPQSQDVDSSVLNPYENPSVVAAAQNVADIGQQITAGRENLAQIPTNLQGDITKTGGIVTNQQLGAELKQAEVPITAKLKELGQQYNAAKSTYSATLSAAKQAISQAKSQVSREQSKVLTMAGKMIDLIKNKELDPTRPDVAAYLSQIEQASGGLLPIGFFASITPKTTTVKSNANVPVFNQIGNAIGTTGFHYIDTSINGYYTKPVPNAGGLTQAAIDQAALQFATTGVMPSIGLGSTGQAAEKRNAIQNRAAELAGGSNISVNKGILAALSSSLKQQTEYANTVERSLANAENGFQQIINKFNKRGINQYDVPIANIIANAAKYNLGSGDVSAFKAALQEVANEYTQVFSRGGQVSDAVRQRAQDVVDGNISINNLKMVLDELQQQGSIVLAGAKNQVQNIQNQMNSLLMNQSLSPYTSPYTSPYSGAFPGISSGNNVSGADYTNLTFTTPDGQVFQFDDVNSLRSFVNKINQQQYGK